MTIIMIIISSSSSISIIISMIINKMVHLFIMICLFDQYSSAFLICFSLGPLDGRLCWTDDHIWSCAVTLPLWRVKFSKSFAANHLSPVQFPLMLHERDSTSKESEPCLKPVLISLTDLLGECSILAQNSYYASCKCWDHGGMSASIEPHKWKEKPYIFRQANPKFV